MLPIGLSKSLFQQLKDAKTFVDIVSKLDEKPLSLISFLGCALQSKAWFAANSHSVVIITAKITDNILSGRLPINDTLARCMAIFKYHLSFSDVLSISDFIVKEPKVADIFLSKIVLMNESPVLRDTFIQCPKLKTLLLSSFCPHIGRAELAGVYKLFLTGDVSDLQMFDFPQLIRILYQCFDWKTKHVEDIERLAVCRVATFSSATGGLALSKYRNFNLLEAKSRTSLENLTFMLSVDSVTTSITYSYFDTFIKEPCLSDLYSAREMYDLNSRVCAEAKTERIRLEVNHIWISFQDKGKVVVGYYKLISNTEELQRKRQEKPQVKLKIESIEEVISTDINRLPDTCLIGLLIYFKNATCLKLIEYKAIDPHFLGYIALKKNLRSLGLIDYRGSLDALLPQITQRIPELNTLIIQKGSLKVEVLKSMIARGSLKEIKIAECLMESGDFSFLSSLKSLSLISIPSSNAMVQNILNCCPELENLEAGDLYAYKYRFPENLRRLKICSKMLESFVEGESFPMLDVLTQLKELIVVGTLSGKLKEVLSKYESRYLIQAENKFII